MDAVAQQESQDIIIKGTNLVLDLERLDVQGEVPRLDVPESIKGERDLIKRRAAYVDWIERRCSDGTSPAVSATSVTIEDEEWKVLTLMIASGVELVEGKVLPAERRLAFELRATLATWSGLALADKRLHRSGGAHLKGVKVGLRAFTGTEAHDYERRGGTINIYRDYPARFECGLVEARRLLDLYGWRLSAHMDEWFLYEVGGPLERELALWLAEEATIQSRPDYLERAHAICPAAFAGAPADDEPAARRKR